MKKNEKTPRTGITLMKTSFSVGKTEVYKEYPFTDYGGPDLTWKTVCQEKDLLNARAGEDAKYWIKYK